MSALLNHLPNWVWLVPALPLLVVVINGARVLLGLASGDAAESLTARLSSLAAFGGLVLLLAIDGLALLHGAPGHRRLGHWFGTGNWEATFSFMLDPLSLTLGTLTALIGWLVIRFSANYLHREAGFHRFFIALSFFLAGIQLVLLAGNGLLAFVGWEMCGVSSFLLIGYAWHRPVATGNALFAFITNRGGDAGFLLGLGLAATWLGGFEWTALSLASKISVVNDRLLVIGFVIAALAKSAQLPFSAWISRALEGPTPSSAIFYGAVMIHAGVYLMLRLEPLLVQVPDVMFGLVVAGLLTAIYAWLCGLVQTDVKSALIFATLFQVSLMFVAIGLGWTTLALVHLCLHAAWRIWQFLLAPSWLAMTRDRPPPPPAWLRHNQLLYTIALQRFWLDKLSHTLLVEPTESFSRDVRALEEHFIDHAIGQPGQGKAVHADRPLVVADGLPGRVLAAVSDVLQHIEYRLLLRGKGGMAEKLMHRAGAYLRTLEHLLEQPRYLMMAVMATFVVIL
uniref:NADH-Ubiquinone oxidoreductase (Complex I), chain 5/L, N-terminal:NADH/Ubiquinone/plastoquinone (Complex I) n=1 Tax=Dechloromonas aromatica (strain RCB) TaxID=159087 RepID=Q47IK8_DECAR